MKRLTSWLERQGAWENRRPRLDDALLTDRAGAYAWYRLRFLGWRMLLRAVLHMIEVSMFAAVFSLDVLAPVLVVRTVAMVGVGAWWGGLEQLRSEVRRSGEKGAWFAVRQHIDAWLLVSVTVAVLIVGGMAGWFGLRMGGFDRFDIFDAYVAACLLRLAIDLVARTYHSGLFALRRIYRPLWSLVAGDVLEVVLIIALWRVMFLWCFGPAIIIGGFVRVALLYYYVRRSYRASRIPALEPRLFVRSFKHLRARDLGGFLRHGLANSVFQIDAALILALLYASVRRPEYLPLAVLFYVLRPFVIAGYGWARMFYFDFKRLALGQSQFFRGRFERFLKRVALAFSLATVGLAVGWTAAFWRGPGLGWDLAVLAPFFIARSLFGLYQTQAFSYEKYRYLFVTGVIVGLGIVGIGLLPTDRLIVFSALAALMIVVVVVGGPPRGVSSILTHRELVVVPLPRWLALLASTGGGVRVGAARVNTRSGGVARVMKALASELGDGAIARHGRNLLLWFESGGSGKGIDLARLAVVTAGCLSDFELSDAAQSGPQALASISRGKILGERLAPLVGGEPEARATPEELRDEFRKRFDAGEIVELTRGTIGARRDRLSPMEVRRVMIDVLRAAGGRTIKPRAGDKVDVSVYAPGGEPEILFVLERSVDARERARWRRRVEDATLVGSLDGAGAG